MDAIKYFITPILCAFIGWLTNYLAVKMLFHPREPKKFLFFTLQGIFPKRKKTLAHNLGDMIERELISHQDINNIVQDEAFKDKFKTIANNYIDRIIEEKVLKRFSMLAMLLNESMREKIKGMFSSEVDVLITNVLEMTATELRDKADFKELIRDRVERFSTEKLEEILFAILKKEFRFIEFIGAALGLLIGAVQSLILYFL